ncbi:MAG TPA: hypothetical protein ENG83_08110 [Nitrospirae bacterium]|nr:hypothetical protein BMS3Abin06_00485 [bacterium BMS3Abin06]HDH12144.1 hypothetical protein [Nitrospirota bacterium]HDZ00117.1 hypothetical protein [Nitrospirota bacterium]
MQRARHTKKDIFADVIEKIQFLTPSQQKFLQEVLSHPVKVSTASKKKILKKSFGVWADRKDIKESTEYVNDIRRGWQARLDRINA